MKKIGLLVGFGLCSLLGGINQAQGTTLEIAPQVGISLSGQGDFGTGVGAALFVGARMDDLSLGVQTAAYGFNFSLPASVNANVTGGYSMLEFVALLKKRFGAGPAYFIVNLGAGGALYNDNSSGSYSAGDAGTQTIHENISEFDPMVKVSVGLGFKLSPGSELTFETGPDLAFSNGYRVWHLPFETGLAFF